MTANRASDDAGSVTLWILGCCLMLLALGGLSIDLWRSFSTRRALAAAADAAALSGASAIDADRYRVASDVLLVPDLAEARARESLERQLDIGALRGFAVRADTRSVTVEVRGDVPFSLLRLVGDGGFEVEVAATALPRRSP